MSYKAAYITLLTKAAYLPGTLVLEHSLRSVGSRYPLVVMVVPNLPQEARGALKDRGITTIEVEYLWPESSKFKLSAHDARFADTWTKLRSFELFDYDRIVLLDSDMLVMKNMDELMDLDIPKDWIAAAHVCACNPRKISHYPTDWIPANCAYNAILDSTSLVAITESSPRPYTLLNSGTVVLNPSVELSQAIRHYLSTSPLVSSFLFPDQDLLANFFEGRWRPLPWYYNALKTLRNIHKQLWSDDEVRCLHYILPDKPWHRRGGEGIEGEYGVVDRWWWAQLDQLVHDMRKNNQKGWQLVLANVSQ